MKTIVILFFIIPCASVFSQDLFSEIESGNFLNVSNYSGDVNIKNKEGATALMWAIYHSDIKMLQVLITKGADINLNGTIQYSDNSGNNYCYGSCLAVASGENKIDILKYLVEEKNIPVNTREYNPKTKRNDGWTALEWAAVKGNYPTLKYLISKNADINSITSEYHRTPLILAVLNKNYNCVKLLVKSGATVDTTDLLDKSPLIYAIETKQEKATRFLYKKSSDNKEIDKNIRDLLKDTWGVESVNDI